MVKTVHQDDDKDTIVTAVPVAHVNNKMVNKQQQ
jgi:hypothetical protein